ncbi:MAG: hypothetical protein A2V70_06110 [Planctomycetes bacterium RBG_13_63_9]|nr:MAG: hypothetical protein A2V70_06110 [Planctomycetes bacterium RBG_13_63_9]
MYLAAVVCYAQLPGLFVVTECALVPSGECPMAEDHYITLSVQPNASPPEIKQAYLDAVRKCHPDLHPGDYAAKRRFQQVQGAFEVLHDPEKRKAYNRFRVSSYTVQYEVYRESGFGSACSTHPSTTHYATIQVAEPVIGLIVTTALGMSVQLFALFGYLLHGGGATAAGEAIELPALLGAGLSVWASVIGCVLGTVVIAGAIRMNHLENYRLALVAAIVATLSCGSPWFLLGLPFGVWTLVVLCDGRVKDAFWS